MPSLRHWDKTEPFNPAKSEVLAWLSRQPELLAWLWSRIKNRRLVTYDPLTQRWRGVGTVSDAPADGAKSEMRFRVSN
jgi:hypothetical protein